MSIQTRLQGSGPYVLGGSMVVLEQLSKVAGLISLPSVTPAIELGLSILNVVQNMRGNEETCQMLMTQLGKLMLVALSPWVSRAENDLPTRLCDDLRELEEQLKTVLLILEQAQSPPWWKALLWAPDSIPMLAQCRQIMDQAMSIFQVDALIEGALQHNTIDQDTDVTEQNIPTDLEAIAATDLNKPWPHTLFGRGDYLEDLVGRLCDKTHKEKSQPASTPPRLAILGPSGIGKTTVALAAMSDYRVKSLYGDRIHWVPCDEAVSPELFVELIARSMGVPRGKGASYTRDIVDFLRSTPNPRLILLDNFDTPWDIPTRQSDIDEIVFDIASASPLTILFTMMSEVLPATRIQWTSPILPPLTALSLTAARKLYLDIHKDAGSDTDLDNLLHKLAYMPLAVRLMANRGRLGESPGDLLVSWEDERMQTELLPEGDDRIASIILSVKLSVNSNLVRKNPDALTLLSVLAELPGGARLEFINDLTPTIVDFTHALATLHSAALVLEHPSTCNIQLLPAIRSVVLDNYPAAPDLLNSIRHIYFNIVQKYKSTPGQVNFLEAEQVLGSEAVNIETILLDAIANEPSDSCIDVAYNYAAFQLASCPRADLIENAIRAVRNSSGSPRLLSRGLVLAGKLYCALGQHDDAVEAEIQALEVYQKIRDQSGEAASLQSLVTVCQILGRHEDVVVTGKQALAVYQTIGDQLGEANSCYNIGEAFRLQERYDDAMEVEKQALVIYKRIDNQLGEANVLRGLGEIYRMAGRYNDAMQAGEQAVALYVRADSRLAVEVGEQALLVYKGIGDQLGVANSIQSLGNVYRMIGRLHDAKKAGKAALVAYKRIGSQLGEANSLQSLGKAYYKLGQYGNAEKKWRHALLVYRQIDCQLGEAASLDSLGQVYRILGRYDDAVEVGKEALAVYKQIPNRMGEAASLANLGLAYKSQCHREKAVQVIQEALLISRSIGGEEAEERCCALLRSLGTDPFNATSLFVVNDDQRSPESERSSDSILPQPKHSSGAPASLSHSDSVSSASSRSGSPHQQDTAPITAADIPTEWIYPMPLTLEELFKGGKYTYRITTRLLSGAPKIQEVDVDVKPGWKSGTRISFPAAGNEREPGVFQDMIFVVEQVHHERFARLDGGRLVVDQDIDVADALCEDVVRDAREVVGLDGNVIRFRPPMGVIRPGKETAVKGQGMWNRSESKVAGRGDLIIRWNVVFPNQP